MLFPSGESVFETVYDEHSRTEEERLIDAAESAFAISAFVESVVSASETARPCTMNMKLPPSMPVIATV